METELLAVLSQAPALVIIVWLVMKQQNGNGSTELIRTIARSLEKMADAQAEANRIAEKRAEGFEKWVELQKTQCQQQFVSRNQK
jgi:hypothetical protein|tara:strand:- start:609 stop:863 length:255 start_codon:yes stop_codon:yes gene_type:complete